MEGSPNNSDNVLHINVEGCAGVGLNSSSSFQRDKGEELHVSH